MARKAYGLHATQVNTGTYADDPAYPIGSNEWNEAPDPAGMLGFTPATANSSTIIIASGVATITDSVSVIAGEGATTDTLQKLALTNTSQYDLVYLFAASGSYNITLEHEDLNADGEISTVSGSNETLSTTVPTILMRKGNYWYGYGGGVVNAVSDIGDVTISGIASGELLKWNGSAWINQTLTEAGIVNGNLGTPSALVGTNISGTAANLTAGNATLAAGATALATARTIGGTSFDGTGNIAITTNANLTGEVTSSGNATTIAGNIVDEANLKVSNGPTNGYMLTAQSGNTGGLTWASAGGGAHTEQGWDVYTSHTGTATTADGIAQMFARRIDANNDGLYIMLWKNGASTEVQIA